VCEVYKIAPRENIQHNATHCIDKALKKLESWQMRLPPFLQQNNRSDPSTSLLHMRCHQLILLTSRPVFFGTVKRTIGHRLYRGIPRIASAEECRYIQTCIRAARSNMFLSRWIIESNRKLLQAGLHFTFNAAVVLLLQQMMLVAQHDFVYDPYTSILDADGGDIQFAMATFEAEAKTGTGYQRDCFNVLRDLWFLAERFLARLRDPGGNSEIMTGWVQDDGQRVLDGLSI